MEPFRTRGRQEEVHEVLQVARSQACPTEPAIATLSASSGISETMVP